jgi:hypothetical protein
MMWAKTIISFRPNDHPTVELSQMNLPFMVKIPIGMHQVTKILIDNDITLNLIMRHTYLEMNLLLAELQPIDDTFHDVILGVSSKPLSKIDLMVVCGTGETLTFEVVDFDIGYNYILGRLFFIKFMAVIHSAYALMKIPGPKGLPRSPQS